MKRPAPVIGLLLCLGCGAQDAKEPEVERGPDVVNPQTGEKWPNATAASAAMGTAGSAPNYQLMGSFPQLTTALQQQPGQL